MKTASLTHTQRRPVCGQQERHETPLTRFPTLKFSRPLLLAFSFLFFLLTTRVVRSHTLQAHFVVVEEKGDRGETPARLGVPGRSDRGGVACAMDRWTPSHLRANQFPMNRFQCFKGQSAPLRKMLVGPFAGTHLPVVCFCMTAHCFVHG